MIEWGRRWIGNRETLNRGDILASLEMGRTMKKIRKKYTAAFSLLLLVFLLSGCGKKEETANVRVAALKGPTAMGMVQLMEEAGRDLGDGMSYNFAIYASIDEVTPKLVQSEVDIAAVPANFASVLYNNTKGQIQVLAVNTLGVLYLVDMDGSVQSAGDLKGKTIYASGKGATPEYALNYILEANGMDKEKDVAVEWKSEHSECVASLLGGQAEGAVALLPQPFVTTAQMKNGNIRIALDLTEEWNRLQEGEENPSAMITGVIVARKEFVEKNPEAVEKFMEAYRESVDYVNGNIEEAAGLIEKYDIVPAAVAKEALPYCKIVFIDGQEMKEKLSGYLEVLMGQNPKSIGGQLPDEGFYFRGQ